MKRSIFQFNSTMTFLRQGIYEIRDQYYTNVSPICKLMVLQNSNISSRYTLSNC